MNTGKLERLFGKMAENPVVFLALLGVIIFIIIVVMWYKRAGRH